MMVSNIQHELNVLYDIHHESKAALEVVDRIIGRLAPPSSALYRLNDLLVRVYPIFKAARAARRFLMLRRKPR